MLIRNGHRSFRKRQGEAAISTAFLRATAPFYAPLKTSLALQRGQGTFAFTRATTATVLAYLPGALPGDSPVLQTVAIGEARFQNARRISQGVYSTTYADGAPLPDNSATQIGYLAEPQRTSYLSNPLSPATQPTGVIPTGTYTLSVVGAGSATIAAGTLVGTGFGTATAGSPVQITVSVAGTAVVTVSGAPTAFQLENGATATSIIPGTTAPLTRNADQLSYQASGNVLESVGTVVCSITYPNKVTPSPIIVGMYQATGSYPLFLNGGDSLTTYDGVNYAPSSLTITPSTSRQKVGSKWGGTTSRVALNGSLSSAGAFDGLMNSGGAIDIGRGAAMVISDLYGWWRPLSNSQLQMVTK